jgi:hypothetical protein
MKISGLDVLKCDFSDVDEPKFHDVERPLERFFYIQSIQKRNLHEIVEMTFYVSEMRWQVIICLLEV